MSPAAEVSHRCDPRFWRGVAAFGAGEYFAAHEEWEAVWLEAQGAEKTFLAGLIQAAVGLDKEADGKLVAAQRLLTRARGKLTATAIATPVDVVALVVRMDAVLAAIGRGARVAGPAPLALLPGAGETDDRRA